MASHFGEKQRLEPVFVDEHAAEQEVLEEENLEATVGLAIILVLVACSIGFEFVKSAIEQNATKKYKHVVDALFGEMTVLGFLALCTFCVQRTGVFASLSLHLFGDEEELQESFEFIHFALFFVMVIYVVVVTLLINQAKVVEEKWSSICLLCHEETIVERIVRQDAGQQKTFASKLFSFFFPDLGSKESLVMYYGLKKEFVLERSLDYPFLPKSEDQRVMPSFDFAMYLSNCLEKTLEHMVEVHVHTWLFFAMFSVVFYSFSRCVEHNVSILAWSWVVMEWFAILFCCAFHHHLTAVKQAMASKISIKHSNALHDSNDVIKESTPLVESGVTGLVHDQLPAWCQIMIHDNSKRHNRQQLLFWFREHGPHAYHIILQINLVFTSVYWTMLLLVYFPHVLVHGSGLTRVLYVIFASSPVLLWQNLARNIVASITQVFNVGYLRNHHAVSRVIRNQKVEAMIRAFLTLHKVHKAIQSPRDKQIKQSSEKMCRSESQLSLQARNEVERTFDALDTSGDGTLEPDELFEAIQKLGLSDTPRIANEIVRVLDSNGDGVISKDEFVAFYENILLEDELLSSPAEKARYLFKMFDRDGDGEITTSEFKETVETFNLGFTLEEIGNLLRELDEDGSGTISLREFEELVERFFPRESDERHLGSWDDEHNSQHILGRSLSTFSQ